MLPLLWNRFQIDSEEPCPASIRSRGALVLALALQLLDGCSPMSAFPHPFSMERSVFYWPLVFCSRFLEGNSYDYVRLKDKREKSSKSLDYLPRIFHGVIHYELLPPLLQFVPDLHE